MYFLNDKLKAIDLVGGNIAGKIHSVWPRQGPFGSSGGSLQFLGRSGSYIDLPLENKLDAKKSITLLAWVYPESAGPILDQKTTGNGVNLWMGSPRKLVALFVLRKGNVSNVFSLDTSSITPLHWNFLGISYNHAARKASLWVDGKLAAIKSIGDFKLDTKFPLRLGNRVESSRHFRGRIACLQVYDKALDSEQILAAKDLCWRSTRQKKHKIH